MNGWDGFHKSGRYDLKTDIFKAWNAQNMYSNEDRDPYHFHTYTFYPL